MDWESDKAWADRYWEDVEAIIRRVAGKIIEVKPAGVLDDQMFARDYVIASGCIACRLRRSDCKYRDITIRSSRPMSGNITELKKIVDGHVRWMLYGWTDRSSQSISEWIFLDAHLIVQKKLHEGRKEILNHDLSSSFIAIDLPTLISAGVVIDSKLSKPTTLRINGSRKLF